MKNKIKKTACTKSDQRPYRLLQIKAGETLSFLLL